MRKYLLMAVALLAAMALNAKTVDVTTARATAQEFVQQQQATGKRMARATGAASSLTLAHTRQSSAVADAADYYVFTADNAFVIVAGDDRASQVLAYGDRPLDINNMPPSLQFFLEMYADQMEFLLANPTVTVDAPARAPQRTAAIEPLLTATWDQSAPYYNQCPMVNGSRSLTGCPATSLSMVFYYWRFPFKETPTVPSYTFTASGKSYTLDELPSITFDWDNMLDSYSGSYTSDEANAVAWLMRYIGQAEEMGYSPTGSGSYGPNIEDAVRLFGYDEGVQNVYKNGSIDDSGVTTTYTDSDWAALIMEELENGRPIVYCGYSGSGFSMAGHAFNVDGYDGDGKYHVNFGWSGDGNGYYALNAFSYSGYTFKNYQEMIIGIQPPADAYGPAIGVRPHDIEMSCLVGQSTTATFTVKGYSITDGITLKLNDDNNAYSLSTTSIALDDASEWVEVTVTFAPTTHGIQTATVVCSSPGADDVVVTINGKGVLETYAPVMLAPSADDVTLTSLHARWTDQTADKNVASYTLEVNPTAPSILLDQADWSDMSKNAFNQASKADDYMPDGWTFNGKFFYLEDGAISVGRNGVIATPAYDLSYYDKVTVVLTARGYSSSTTSTLKIGTVNTDSAQQTLTLASDMQQYTVVLDAASSDQIVFTAGYYPVIQDIKIYAGTRDDDANTLKATAEAGDETYRLITGITSKDYLVEELQSGGTFYYWVQANYVDGTVSDWSNIMRVTLGEGGPHTPGDVNHDGAINLTDLSLIIDMLLGSKPDGTCCDICADVDGNGTVEMADITMLIDMMLGAE